MYCFHQVNMQHQLLLVLHHCLRQHAYSHTCSFALVLCSIPPGKVVVPEHVLHEEMLEKNCPKYYNYVRGFAFDTMDQALLVDGKKLIASTEVLQQVVNNAFARMKNCCVPSGAPAAWTRTEKTDQNGLTIYRPLYHENGNESVHSGLLVNAAHHHFSHALITHTYFTPILCMQLLIPYSHPLFLCSVLVHHTQTYTLRPYTLLVHYSRALCAAHTTVLIHCTHNTPRSCPTPIYSAHTLYSITCHTRI
jgi:hypothetical protein